MSTRTGIHRTRDGHLCKRLVSPAALEPWILRGLLLLRLDLYLLFEQRGTPRGRCGTCQGSTRAYILLAKSGLLCFQCFISFPFLLCHTLGTAVESTKHLEVCVCLCVLCVCLRGVFCRSKGQVSLSCSGSMKGTLPDVLTWFIQTNSRHRHAVKWLFLRRGIEVTGV